MDITQINEQWIDLPREKIQNNYIISISNTGKYRRVDGTEGSLALRQRILYNSKLERSSHIVAEHFLITVRRPDQLFVDHITHNPTEYNVNDVRNLRWCTKKENSNFEEARENRSKAWKGDKHQWYGRTKELCPNWKGDSAKPHTKCHRALKEYRRNPTQENLATLEEARLRYNEYRRKLKASS